jgi:transposase
VQLLRGLRDDEPPQSDPALYRIIAVAIDRTVGPELDAKDRRIAALEEQVAKLGQQIEAIQRRNSAADMTAYRLRKNGVMPFLLDEAERLLSEDIEFGVIAEKLSLTPAELSRQLAICQEWKLSKVAQMRRSDVG